MDSLSVEGRTEVIESQTTRDHTERMLRSFAVQVETGKAERKGEDARFAAVHGPARLRAGNLLIPGDISSAAYFIAAAALLPGSSLGGGDVGVDPTPVLFLGRFETCGRHV